MCMDMRENRLDRLSLLLLLLLANQNLISFRHDNSIVSIDNLWVGRSVDLDSVAETVDIVTT